MISTYEDYARFMATTTGYYLDFKSKYDPMSIFLSSKIDAVPYQIYDFQKLVQEQRTKGNIRTLIAYETGLGKTILVGMVINELVTPRPTEKPRRPQRILIITPPTVLPQFKAEMENKFGLHFNQFDTKNPEYPNQLIASMDSIKLEPWITNISHQSWDMIIVDEYHRISPDTLRGKLLEKLTRKTKHLIALTATPHDGKTERYEYRMDLIAPTPLVIRRTKRQAIDINNKKLFDQKLHEITEEFPVTKQELVFYSHSEEYARERFKDSGAGALVAIVIGRAVSSSIRAGLKLLTNRRNRLIRQEFEDQDDYYLGDILERVNEGGELSEQEIEAILASRPDSLEALQAELALLAPVIEEGERLLNNMPIDSKGLHILEMLKEIEKRGEKTLIFANFIETVSYLNELLVENDYRPLIITGAVPMNERNRIVEQITKDDRYTVLIGTDAMGESLNLQAACVEINYDVPWSPVAYIQRVGRIWRFGQKRKHLFIHNFLPAFAVERRVMEVMLQKIETINEEFGEVGLSVYGRELGSIDVLVKRAYSGESVEETIESAYQETRKIGQEILQVLKKSMTLPQVVNVEELERNSTINLKDSFSERDLHVFLAYLREIGLGSGRLPDKEYEESTYHVNKDEEWIRVQSLSLNDEGVRAAIEQAKQINQEDYDVAFNHQRKMTGKLVIMDTLIDDKIVSQEPVLVTPEGVLTYRGILALAPDFTDKQSDAVFTPFDEYVKKTGAYWLEYRQSIWEDIKQAKQDLIIQEKDEYRKDWLRADLENWIGQTPTKVEVIERKLLKDVDFVARWSKDAWRARREVELCGMDEAMRYYREKGYTVSDVSGDNCGYDVLCRRNDGILRVEVKGLKVMPYPQLSHNEYLAAEFYRDSFVLFVVKITDEGLKRYEIFDPVNNIEFNKILRPVYVAKGFEEFILN